MSGVRVVHDKAAGVVRAEVVRVVHAKAVRVVHDKAVRMVRVEAVRVVRVRCESGACQGCKGSVRDVKMVHMETGEGLNLILSVIPCQFLCC